MPISLSKEHRKLLEKTTAAARVLSESASRAALENLAVHEKTFRSHMSDDQKKLRNSLRARGRALGDRRDERSGIQDIRHLTELAAYEHWHRLLFTRFLTENNLLITDAANGNVPVTLEECEELAPELGARDGLDLACRFAGRTLPGVFRKGDPVLDLPIALNDQVELRKLLAVLPPEIFRADDALGWTYQFWQAQRKNEVNKSGKKMGADEIAPVTQLFTEDYMVEFLLHNTLGAWWAGKMRPIKADTEEEARAKVALPARGGVSGISWNYLRFVQDETTKTWSPAVGAFDGWPKFARLIRLLDPCMGSGHFLVFALPILVRLRIEEEKLSAQAAVVAVLRDNIHGLEIDERCTQIAAFNVALTAWKLAGYQALPSLNLACSGLAPSTTEEEWVALAGDSDRLQRGMARLYSLFKDAPELGSLINPCTLDRNLIEADFHELAPLLTAALVASDNQKPKTENDAIELVVIAQGLAKAAELLAGQFTLVITNVPYLGRGKQNDVLKGYCGHLHPEAKSDLATCFVDRCLEFCGKNCSTALVSTQYWLFLTTYKKLRKKLLNTSQWDFLVRLGSGAFETISGEVVNVALLAQTQATPSFHHNFIGLDLSGETSTGNKAGKLGSSPIIALSQKAQLNNPNSKIVLQPLSGAPALEAVAIVSEGLHTGDYPRFGRKYWEISRIAGGWSLQQGGAKTDHYCSGMEHALFWEEGDGELIDFVRERLGTEIVTQWIKGDQVWGKCGVAVGMMGNMKPSIYQGALFTHGICVIIPKLAAHTDAIRVFSESKDFCTEIRKLDQKVCAALDSVAKIPFDLPHWQKVAAEKYPDGLPKPHSDDPTQWLFNGNPKCSTQPLHVAVARLLDYRWPRQTGSSFPDCPALGLDGLESFADEDGIVCLPPLSREQPAASRLRQLLTAALGAHDERALIATAGLKGSKSKTLEDWLRDEFFAQHAKLFHDRPFIWHICDGRPDGFHALVNYHKLDHAMLQKLTYSYLGNWIQQQSDDAKADKPGAADRLGAAKTLQNRLASILEGEAPLDIFVRWKPLKDQAQGWHPDINDGIRQNIRPFLLAGDVGKKGAGLFRTVPLKLKDKDRGKEPQRLKKEHPWFWCEEEPGTDPVGGEEFVGARWNNVHLTLARKKEAIS